MSNYSRSRQVQETLPSGEEMNYTQSIFSGFIQPIYKHCNKKPNCTSESLEKNDYPEERELIILDDGLFEVANKKLVPGSILDIDPMTLSY